MSSRKENDDPWLAYVSGTADRGPRLVLRQVRGCGLTRMTTGPSPGGDRMSTQQDQRDHPGPVGEPGPTRPEQRTDLAQQTDQAQPQQIVRQSDGWQILSYMLGGMILY